VRFLSPHDGQPMLLTPEHSISLQNTIGADIIMQLDDVVASLTTGPRVEEVRQAPHKYKPLGYAPKYSLAGPKYCSA